MTFLYPLGLLGLILIPVIVLVYIIKNRYTEQTVTSTYIWTLSEKFLKRRAPINKIVGIISLVLQIVAAIALSLAISHPIASLKGAAYDYCFVLDASGSMTTLEGKQTRFDIAKGEIQKIIDSSVNGSSYTLIYAGNTAEAVFEDITDKRTALNALDGLTMGYGEDNFVDALSVAQDYFNNNSLTKTYLFTDANATSDNVTVVKVGGEAQNIALSNAQYVLTDNGVTVTGSVISYLEDVTVHLELYFDGAQPDATLELSLEAGNAREYQFQSEVTAFKWLRVAIKGDDAQMLDNEVIVYNLTYDNAAKTLIVSDAPTIYLRAALLSAGLSDVETVTAKDYSGMDGYGLYVFDNVLPDVLPDDGAVWFVNPQGSVAGANFSFRGVAEARSFATYSTSTATAVRKLLSGVTQSEFELKQYGKCGISGKFSTLISCEGNPLVFAGANAYGNREVVFAFDLRDAAAFTLSDNFTTLVCNLLDYSFPAVVSSSTFYAGEIVEINMIAGVESVTITTPRGDEIDLPTTGDVSEYQLDEVGLYSVTLKIKNKPGRNVSFFAALPESERTALDTEQSFVLAHSGSGKQAVRDGKLDLMLAIVIFLIVVAVADYGVYCYEQYQLR